MPEARRVTLVTGAAQGIGLGIARRLAQGGMRVVVNDLRDDLVRSAAEQIVSEGGVAIGIAADVSDWHEVSAMCAQVNDTFGGLEVLVNNAGIIRRGTLETMSLEDWHQVIAVNLTGTFYCCRAAVPYLKAGVRGRIVNVASITGKTGDLASAPGYASSKAGMLALTKTLARELAPWGITVNAVAPHAIETEMSAQWTAEKRAAVLAGIPLGRMGTVEEVAEAVAFLVSEMAGFITGETLDVNGGAWMD